MVVRSRDIIGMGRDGGRGGDFWAVPTKLFSFFVGGEMFALVCGLYHIHGVAILWYRKALHNIVICYIQGSIPEIDNKTSDLACGEGSVVK